MFRNTNVHDPYMTEAVAYALHCLGQEGLHRKNTDLIRGFT